MAGLGLKESGLVLVDLPWSLFSLPALPERDPSIKLNALENSLSPIT